jgi:S-DNA-T family DNA segregation ATPase FtsK/SpoIIIE
MAGGSKISRIHGPFVGDHEVESVVSYLKNQGSPSYMSDITSEDFSSSSGGSFGSSANAEEDELYKQAVEIVQLEGKASTSFIQRCLKIGYNRAANIMEQMEKEGLVGKPNHVGKREILM